MSETYVVPDLLELNIWWQELTIIKQVNMLQVRNERIGRNFDVILHDSIMKELMGQSDSR